MVIITKVYWLDWHYLEDAAGTFRTVEVKNVLQIIL